MDSEALIRQIKDIRTASAHYVGKKRRVEVNLSAGDGKLKVVEQGTP